MDFLSIFQTRTAHKNTVQGFKRKGQTVDRHSKLVNFEPQSEAPKNASFEQATRIRDSGAAELAICQPDTPWLPGIGEEAQEEKGGGARVCIRGRVGDLTRVIWMLLKQKLSNLISEVTPSSTPSHSPNAELPPRLDAVKTLQCFCCDGTEDDRVTFLACPSLALRWEPRLG